MDFKFKIVFIFENKIKVFLSFNGAISFYNLTKYFNSISK